MDVDYWGVEVDLDDDTIACLRDEGFGAVEEMQHVTDDDVRVTFQILRKLPLQQCVILREALRNLRAGKTTRVQTGGSSIADWAAGHGLGTDVVRVLQDEGFTSAGQLAYVTVDDVTETFQKTGKLSLRQCVALREALRKEGHRTDSTMKQTKKRHSKSRKADRSHRHSGDNGPQTEYQLVAEASNCNTTPNSGPASNARSNNIIMLSADPVLNTRSNWELRSDPISNTRSKTGRSKTRLTSDPDSNTRSKTAWNSDPVSKTRRDTVLSSDPFSNTRNHQTRSQPHAETEMRLLVAGKAGSGKSWTVHSITSFLGPTADTQAEAPNSADRQAEGRHTAEGLYTGTWEGQTIHILDTSGWSDHAQAEDDMADKMAADVGRLEPGPHAVLYVVDASDRYTQEDRSFYTRLQAVLTDRLPDHLVVVFTHGDSLEKGGKRIEDLIGAAPEALLEVLQRCENRYVVFNNTAPQEGQTTLLMDVVHNLVAHNRSHPYLPLGKGRQLVKGISRRLAEVEQAAMESTSFVRSLKQKQEEETQVLQRSCRQLEEKRAKSAKEGRALRQQVLDLERAVTETSLMASSAGGTASRRHADQATGRTTQK